MGKKQKTRLVFIIVMGSLFACLIIYSALKVRFDVEAGELNEFKVIKLTLTDGLQRAEDGNLKLTKSPADKDGAEPCPT